MSKIRDEVLSSNRSYAASFGAKADLPLSPARRFAILTCMDARLDPAKYAGVSEGDAHVIRNAGGRATPAATPILCLVRPNFAGEPAVPPPWASPRNPAPPSALG